ncbi:MAG: efflux RND transporter periplasmic adaptor subunit [Nitrospirae bacterium]|nr:MAG: efflux RND transporter periplasmic adaptor subunit [Nitrospirota bacterium]
MGLSVSDLKELIEGTHLEGHRYLLKSPLPGIISSQTVVLGQGIKPGDTLLEVVDTSRVWVFANLPVEQARQFRRGDRSIIVAKGRKPVEAALSFIAPTADPRTLTVRLRFDVENPEHHLLPHEYVEVRLLKAGPSALAIPQSAITLIAGEQGVFVQQGKGFAFVPVTLGRESQDWVEVLAGVQNGDRVVTHGVFDLKNAMFRDAIQGE